VSRGHDTKTGEKVVVYGTGGIGKSELCSLLEKAGFPTLFIDPEESTKKLDVARVVPTTWDEARSVLHDMDLIRQYKAIVFDSFTKGEELAVAWTKANIQTEKGKYVRRLEDYGFGKGFTHVFETFLTLLGDLDAIARMGIHVIATCHDVVETVPNPDGENFLQYQPRLQSPPKTGKIREKVREWCDHLLYIELDKFVEDGKATGSGSRTIYCTSAPTHWAKTRCLTEPVPYPKGDYTIWNKIFGKE
jgi:hypothetical protein